MVDKVSLYLVLVGSNTCTRELVKVHTSWSEHHCYFLKQEILPNGKILRGYLERRLLLCILLYMLSYHLQCHWVNWLELCSLIRDVRRDNNTTERQQIVHSSVNLELFEMLKHHIFFYNFKVH